MEKEKTVPQTKVEAEKERIEYRLTQQAKNQKFEATVLRTKMQKYEKVVLGVKLPSGYVKEIKLENDEKGLLALNPPETKYVATFHEGFSNDTGSPYIAIDVQIHKLVRKRDFLSWVEKVTLAENGLLTESK